MKISIDTATDSHEHIRKVISLLKGIIGESAETTPANIFDSPAPSGGSALAGFFDSAPASPATPEQPTSSPSVDTLKELNAPQEPKRVDIWGNEKKDDDPPLEVY